MKKKGFMLTECLLAMAILGFTIAIINQVLLAKIKRLHQDEAAISIFYLLSSKIENLSQEAKNEKIEQSTLNVTKLLIDKIDIKSDSKLSELKNLIQPVKVTAEITKDGQVIKHSLWGIRNISRK